MVNFVDEYGENVFFDENGDPPASYEMINWQLRDGEVQHVTVGYFSTSTDGTVRDLEGGPNCRVSECQGFITKQRYKRVVIFACDLTTRTE